MLFSELSSADANVARYSRQGEMPLIHCTTITGAKMRPDHFAGVDADMKWKPLVTPDGLPRRLNATHSHRVKSHTPIAASDQLLQQKQGTVTFPKWGTHTACSTYPASRIRPTCLKSPYKNESRLGGSKTRLATGSPLLYARVVLIRELSRTHTSIFHVFHPLPHHHRWDIEPGQPTAQP